jgi:hypothetical protein
MHDSLLEVIYCTFFEATHEEAKLAKSKLSSFLEFTYEKTTAFALPATPSTHDQRE